MKKIRLLIIVDVLAFLGLIVVYASGIIMTKFFGAGAKTVIVLTRGNWYEMHSISSWFFIIMAVIHLLLHFGWIKNIGRLWKSN